MLVDAKDRFIERMAVTINATAASDSPSQIKERWEGFDSVDVKKAQAVAARAKRESLSKR